MSVKEIKRLNQVTDRKRDATERDAQARGIGLTAESADERGEDVFDDCLDNVAESRTDDDADRKLRDVATQNELLEAAKFGACLVQDRSAGNVARHGC